MSVKSRSIKDRKTSPKEDAPSPAGDEPRYAAPALEKGLDVLELLADLPDGLSRNGIAERLGRSVNEIYRMLEVLERRGYIARQPEGHYGLTLKLYDIAQRHPPTERLLTAAWPVLRKLARVAQQSCHLSVDDNGTLLNIAQAASPERLTLAVRLGSRFPFSARLVSARTLAAFQSPSRRMDYLAIMQAVDKDTDVAALSKRLDRIRGRGYEEAPSETLGGITDLSVPILDASGAAIAALTIPYLEQIGLDMNLSSVRAEVRRSAREIELTLRNATTENL